MVGYLSSKHVASIKPWVQAQYPKKKFWAGEVAKAIEYLPIKHEALNSKPSITKKNLNNLLMHF
jgi:hypothetical protein